VDLHGHVNNAAYWQAVEQRLAASGPDATQPLRARLEYRAPIDFGEEVELLELAQDGCLDLAFVVVGAVKAAASIETAPGARRTRPTKGEVGRATPE
jgi:acyl-ACP thioesterase